MKVAFVVPRYGVEVAGGAENAARTLAEHLVSEGRWQAEVITTCAQDAMTWEDVYEPGTVEVNGVPVHRFRSKAGRDPGFHPYSGGLLRSPSRATMEEADTWIDLQGPLCPDVVDAAAASDADVVAFYPYLYYPTVRGLPLVGARGIMHAAAHDEAPIRLPVFAPVFSSAAGLVFHTYGERELVRRLFGVAERPQIVLGLGVDRRSGDPVPARAAFGIGDRPYLCCVGRVDDQKGCGALWRSFIAYKERRPGPLALAFVGQVVDRPPEHPDLIVTGPVDEDAKWGLLVGSVAHVSPSAMESFSIVMIEAWLAGVPVVVNGRCDATVEHCVRSGGGMWFSCYAELEAVLDRLVADTGLRGQLAEAGRAYSETNFSWPVILGRYRRFLDGVVARAGSGPMGRTRHVQHPPRGHR